MNKVPATDEAVGSSGSSTEHLPGSASTPQSRHSSNHKLTTHSQRRAQKPLYHIVPGPSGSAYHIVDGTPANLHSRTPASTFNISSHGGEDNDWDIIPRVEQSPTDGAATPPQVYQFKGTWPAAFNDTSAALSQVGSATASYASALSRSGLGHASISVGNALLNSANRGARALAGWVMDRSGQSTEGLPRPVGQWLRTEAQRREDARKMRESQRGRRRRIAMENVMRQTWSDERGEFVIETAEMDATGEFIGPLSPVDGSQRKVVPEQDDGYGTLRKIREGRGWTRQPLSAVDSRAESSLTGAAKDEEEEDGYESEDDENEEDDDDDQSGDGLIRLFEYDD